MTTDGIFSLLHQVFGDHKMAELMSARATVGRYLRIEAELATAEAEVGLFDFSVADEIKKTCETVEIDYTELWEGTAVVGYPILPLLRQVIRAGGDNVGRWLHFGATTQDIMDTADSMGMVDCLDRLDQLLAHLGDGIADLVDRYADAPMAGRTHALQAVPITFGAKMAVYLDQIARSRDLVASARTSVGFVELFGAAGTSAGLAADAVAVRDHLAAALGLTPSPGPRHVARDHVADFVHTCAAIAGLCGRLARELIDLGRTEIGEITWSGPPGQGASSTMPQKSNPIHCEAIVGMSSTVYSLSAAGYRAMEAGHERSAGEWQIEWHVLPQVATLTGGCLLMAREAIERAQIHPDRMVDNMRQDHGLIFAEAAMFALSDTYGRAVAHELVSEAAVSARTMNATLQDALAAVVPDPVAVPSADNADSAVGSAVSDAEGAVARWNVTRDRDRA